MEKLDEIIQKLNSYPRGYISAKTIKGRKYFYLQKRNGSKIESTYIGKNYIKEIRKQLLERERLEDLLDELSNSEKPIKKALSKNEESLTGYVMSGNLIVCKVVDDEIVWKDDQKCPLIFLKSKYLSSFLNKRVIDTTRVNSRFLRKALNISLNTEDDKIPIFVNGVVITDNFWFRPKGSKLIYEDVKFNSDLYSEVSLNGDLRFIPKTPRKTPQITLIGSFEKCWKLIDNEWWLYKKGNENEIFSEIFCSKFAELIGVPTAFYERDGEYIRTRNFTDVCNFEPISSVAGEDDSYDNVFNSCLSLGIKFASEYLKLVYFDALVENVDRHNENLGFLRNKKTGKILSLAPNFDNNVALISRVNFLNEDRKKYGLMKSFIKFLKENEKACLLFKELEFVTVTKDLINLCFEMTGIQKEKENITNFILNGFELIKQELGLNIM